METKNSLITGLVLSGGGTRGYAHIGAIRALEEHGIEADMIAGTSVGSIVGVLYADGYAPDEIFKILSRYRLMRISRPVVFRKGLLDLGGLRKPLRKYVRARRFEELEKPLYVTVTNLSRKRAEYMHEGPLEDYIVASASIPGLFTPVKINGELFSDGGIMDNFPVAPIRDLCDRIVGINLMPGGGILQSGRLKTIFSATMHLHAGNAGNKTYKNQCELLIEPQKITRFGFLGNRQRKKLYALGYHTAKEILEGPAGR